jgi:hypothetical protein
MAHHDCPVFPEDDLLDRIYDQLEAGAQYPWPEQFLHLTVQDTRCAPWIKLLELVEQAAFEQWECLSLVDHFSQEERASILTLPPSIARLKSVRKLVSYRSGLLRLPAEIGEMEKLEEFVPYTSYGLHWFPYEITRCRHLSRTIVSTRALYGNYKFRPPFPRINTRATIDAMRPSRCSICGHPLTSGVVQAWHSLPVGTDVLPLLVNACSQQCIDALPDAPDTYIQRPHHGGLSQRQADAKW